MGTLLSKTNDECSVGAQMSIRRTGDLSEKCGSSVSCSRRDYLPSGRRRARAKRRRLPQERIQLLARQTSTLSVPSANPYPSLVGREIAIAVTPEPNQMVVAPNAPKGFEGELVDFAEALSSCLGFKYL